MILENGILWDGIIFVENGKIVRIETERNTEMPIGVEVIDAKGAYVGPGFVDIHVHGGGGFDTCLNAKEASEYFLSHGETSILATPSYSINFKELMEAIREAKEGMKVADSIRGLYLEGPFINPN